jgi:hypothetical protein
MWHDLTGYVPGYGAGTSGTGTVVVPSGGCITGILAHASVGSATVTIFGGAAIPIINGAPPTFIPFNHDLYVSNSGNSGDVVFLNTDVAVVFWVRAGNY